VAASVAGQQRERCSYLPNPPADPVCIANKVDHEQCLHRSPCATLCVTVLPLAAMPSLAFVILPCRPLLLLCPLCRPPLCHPLPSLSCHSAPCYVARCCHCTTLHWCDPPPCAAFCAAIMMTVPPFVNATHLPLKDIIWIWQNEFLSADQIKFYLLQYYTLTKFTNLFVFRKVNCHKTSFVFSLKNCIKQLLFPLQVFLTVID
jgi:hypothetical protein